MNGILERIEEKVEKLEILISRLSAGNLSPSVEGDGSGEVLDEIDETEQTENEERDNNGKGVTWDARIHTSNKARTQKDIWKRKPGLEDAFFDSVMAELKSGGGVKALPEKKSPPNKKTPPGKKLPPSKKGDDQKFKPKTLDNINTICKDHGATIETVISTLLEKHGIDTFDTLPKNLHAEVYEESHDWLTKLKAVQEEVTTLDKMADENDEYRDDINSATKAFIQEAGAADGLLGSVAVDGLEGLRKELIAYSDQWAEFFSE